MPTLHVPAPRASLVMAWRSPVTEQRGNLGVQQAPPRQQPRSLAHLGARPLRGSERSSLPCSVHSGRPLPHVHCHGAAAGEANSEYVGVNVLSVKQTLSH